MLTLKNEVEQDSYLSPTRDKNTKAANFQAEEYDKSNKIKGTVTRMPVMQILTVFIVVVLKMFCRCLSPLKRKEKVYFNEDLHIHEFLH